MNADQSARIEKLGLSFELRSSETCGDKAKAVATFRPRIARSAEFAPEPVRRTELNTGDSSELLVNLADDTVRGFQCTLHPPIPAACVFPSKMNSALATSIQRDIADLPHIVLGVRAALPGVVRPAVRNSSFKLFRNFGEHSSGIR